jgi:hypothetical protein
LLGLGRFLNFLIYTQSIDLLGRGSARRKEATYTHRHPCLVWDSNPQLLVSTGEDNSCLTYLGHSDRLSKDYEFIFEKPNKKYEKFSETKDLYCSVSIVAHNRPRTRE